MPEIREDQLNPKEQLFNIELSKSGLNELAKDVSSICDRDIETNLSKTRLKDERKHWEAGMWLAGIILDNPVQAPKGKDTKPWEYTIDMQTSDELGKSQTETLDARMVGQTMQKLFAYAEVWRHHVNISNPTERDNFIAEKAYDITLRHFEEVIDKFELSQEKDSSGASAKKILDQHGMTSFTGIDKANPEDILLILNALKQRSQEITPEEKTKINKTLGIAGVILHREEEGKTHFDKRVTKTRHLTDHED